MDDDRRQQALEAVRAYLQGEFPGRDIEGFSDARRGQGFRVRGVAAPVLVSDVLLDDMEPEGVGQILADRNLADLMRTPGKDTVVVVTTEGIRAESLSQFR